MHETRPALCAEVAVEHAAAVRRPREAGDGLVGGQREGREDCRGAKGAGGLLAALEAVAVVDGQSMMRSWWLLRVALSSYDLRIR